MVNLELLKTSQYPPLVTQSKVRRDWMDNTYARHAYQCYPMTMANVMGWEVQLENDVTVIWDGGNSVPRILSGAESSSGRQVCSASIIGQISFHIGYVFRTQKPYEVAISGSPNFDFNGAIPLTAYIPSSWWPDEVFMNWRIEKANEEITFKSGFPFVFLTVIDSSLLENVNISIGDYWKEMSQEKIESRVRYSEMKSKLHQESPWKGWAKGIKSGIDADGNRLNSPFTGLPKLHEPK